MVAAQSDLVEEPRLAGLTQAEGIVTRNEEQALIASIGATRLSPFRFHGWLGKRMTASFGWNYDLRRRASRRRNQFLTGCFRCARGRRGSRASNPMTSFRRC
jgi:hypothetical protein